MRKRRVGLHVLALATPAVCLGLMTASCGGKPEAPASQAGGELLVLCGAGIRPPMEELKAAFEKENNCTVSVNYAGSGTLLGQLQSGAEADVYVPGDVAYIKAGQGKDLIASAKVLAWFVPVLAVQKGNPKGVKGLADLARTDLEVGLGQPDACAVGGVARDLLKAARLADRVKPDFEALTVNRLANQVKLKSLDVALIWDATAAQYTDSIDVVPVEDANFHAVPFAAGITKNAPNADLAARFADFAAGDSGADVFRRHHYTVPGKEIRVGCGSSFRPVIEELIARFQSAYGVEAKPNYGGSGTVLLQIEEAGEGDIYVCHDPYAKICEAKDLSAAWHTMAYIAPTIAVKRGNPKNVKGLMDLLRDDIRVGLPERETSTRGRVLWAIFKKQGVADKMTAHGFVEDRTHALVNKLLLDAVDVAVLWDAPTKAMEEIEAVPIEEKYQVDSVTSATGKTYPVDRLHVTVVRLNVSKEPLLAAQFAKLCLSPVGRDVLKRHKFTLPPAP